MKNTPRGRIKVCWLRARLPNPELRAWLQKRHGAGLSNRQLRFWELILDLPHREVNAWLANPARQVWEGRYPCPTHYADVRGNR